MFLILIVILILILILIVILILIFNYHFNSKKQSPPRFDMSKTKKNILKDRHGRTLNYLRLAVTDRCNLRCFYCMPEEGIKFTARENLLTYEEMLRLLNITASMGVNKVRITGGEPFVRKNMVDFMHNVSRIEGIDTLNLTTNGTMSADLSLIHI